jgi:protein TonB
MAQDVDLSSHEWTEIIFEGKNKEFGAYTLRNASAKRHNLAMLSVVAVIILAFLVSLGVSALERAAEEGPLAEAEQEMVSVDTAQEDEQEPEEEQERFEEPEKEEVLPEEVLNTVKVTELSIVDDDQVSKEDEIKTQDELTQTETAFGASDFDKGTDDVSVVREHKEEIVVEEKKPEPEKIFTAVEQAPKFPGGDAEMYKWLSNHIRYPEQAAQNNIQGRVTVQFVVEKDGSIGEVKVVRGKDPDLDKEAVRVVKSMPKFVPGKMNGQAVRVWFTLPINFKLQGS